MINPQETIKVNKRKGFWFKAGYSVFDIYTKNIGITPAFIYLFLRSYKNKETGLSFPSEEFIADTLGINRKTVIRAIKILKAHGFIEIKKVKYQGQWVHNVYVFKKSTEWLSEPNIKKDNSLPWDKNYPNQETKIHTKKIKDKKNIIDKNSKEKDISTIKSYLERYKPECLKNIT